MADPVAKAKYEELKTTYNTLQSRLREIESEMFDIGVQLGVLQAQLKESGEIPKTFDDMFPAHAGMNRNHVQAVFFHSNVPRTRGDEPRFYKISDGNGGCSPHTRG